MRDEESSGAITIFVAAKSAIVRAGLEALVRADERFQLIGSAAKMSALFNSSDSVADVILLDLEREDFGEFSDLNHFWNEIEEGDSSPATITLLASDLLSVEQTTELLMHGARGVLSQAASSDQIRAAIEATAAGLIVVPPEMMQDFLNGLPNAPKSLINTRNELPNAFTEALTAREIEVLEMMTEGASNKTIANQLKISEHTVKFHVSSIFAKLGVTTRTEAVTQALRQGLIML